jgi:GDP-fucose transporter C1
VTGTFLEGSNIRISILGTLMGVASSMTTALHAIIIKKSLENVRGSTLDLVYYNNLLSALALAPFVVLTGELQKLHKLFIGSTSSSSMWWGSESDGYVTDADSSMDVLRALFVGGIVTVSLTMNANDFR